ncbi:DUF4998 domain-containing protein [Niabella beijingensis]|uniref:DUF4998 domain-containing protein n=1 Tax=Niabella beijingensis TaxID=2872700 RepID=UPI001CBB5B71|nr:DUF4998 domain-containing protein [Niabella beijingensis]MBZ4190526.1 hypothetical protein [Niabella beijingensis]
MNDLIKIVCGAVLLLLIAGCKKMDDTYREYVVPQGITYAERPKNVNTYSGLRRVLFRWPAPVDPSVAAARIYWNNFSDSVEFAIPKNADTVSYMLNIPEGAYSFIIKTFDEKQNTSVPVEVQGRSIGETFLSNMFDRPLNQVFVDNRDGQLRLSWGSADVYNGSIGQELTYTGNNNKIKTVFLPAEEGQTVLDDYKRGGDLFYTTLYRPDSTSIDTLKTAAVKIPGADVRYRLDPSKFGELILDNDALCQYPQLGWKLSQIWSGITNQDPGYHSADLPKPLHITFDIGTSDYAIYSFRTWQRTAYNSAFTGGNLKSFALWGSNQPAQDGSWAGWTKLGTFNSGQHNVTEGELFLLPSGLPAFRYIRIQALATWDPKPTQAVWIMGIELMGTYAR